MLNIEALRAGIAEPAKDVKLNLSSVLTTGALTEGQRWGIAVACAIAARNPTLRHAVLADAKRAVEAGTIEPGVIEDALAAAALMAMNNVYYRFRHLVGKDSYAQKPARLRMQRIAKPATSRTEFELYCLAVSAINGCEVCIRSHEEVVLEGGLTEEHVHDAVRVAAVIQSAAVALEASAGAADAIAA